MTRRSRSRSRSRSSGRRARSPAPARSPATARRPALAHSPATARSPAPAHSPATARSPAPAHSPAPVHDPPRPASHAPPPVAVQVKSGGGIIAQGLAFGAGFAVANRAVAAARESDACKSHSKVFQECLNSFGGDVSKCQYYLDALNKCRGSSCS